MAVSAQFTPGAMACGSLTQRITTNFSSALALPLLLDLSRGSGPSLRHEANGGGKDITGLWKSILVSDGAVVMVEFDTWHKDGTELALDGLFPPATGQICPGVWEKTGPNTYATVHPAFEYDAAGVNIVAIFIERMRVTLSDDGNSFQGTFTWENYDFRGNLLPGAIAGTVTGTRIEVSSAFPFPFPI